MGHWRGFVRRAFVFADGIGPLDRRPAGTDAVRLETWRWPGPPDCREAFSNPAVVDEPTLLSLAAHATALTTSVSIDPATRQAKSGALFEVEHIKRWSLLHFEVTYLDPIVRGIREFLNSKNPGLGAVSATLNDFSSGRFLYKSGLALLYRNRPAPDESQPTCVPRVMISYSHADKNVARRLASDLQERTLDVWLDEREVLVGDWIHEKVEEGVSGCDYLVALLSPNVFAVGMGTRRDGCRSDEREEIKEYCITSCDP